MSAQRNRLDKLLRLIDEGVTAEIKSSAVQQAVEVVRSRPTLAPVVFSKIQILLYKKTWETRVAASNCLGLLAQHMMHFRPADLVACVPRTASVTGSSTGQAATFALSEFDIGSILENGTLLLESSGQAYDPPAGQMTKDELAKQKGALKARLGIKGAMGSIMDTDELVDEQDLQAKVDAKQKEETAEASKLLEEMKGMSARDRIQLKRKLKAAASKPQQQRSKKAKLNEEASQSALGPNQTQVSYEFPFESLISGSWPFQRLADCLVVDCLHQMWETRHGGALGLRELMTYHAACAAVVAPVADPDTGWAKENGAGKLALADVSEADVSGAQAANQSWLEDCIVHLLCVLALDRFGDFISDQVVAPVRETAAQALGFASRPLPASSTQKLAGILAQLTLHENWNVRHAGLLGIKYLMAARPDLCDCLLEQSFPSVMRGLKDEADDVKATAADSLIPAIAILCSWPDSKLAEIKQTLWSLLDSCDDLSLAPGSVMGVLASLYSSPQRGAFQAGEVEQAVLRLLPFFRHTIMSVRRQAAACLQAILSQTHSTVSATAVEQALPVLYLNLIMEGNSAILDLLKASWTLLLQQADAASLAKFITPEFLQAAYNVAVSARQSFDAVCVDKLLSKSEASLRQTYKAARMPEEPDLVRMQFACSAALAQLAAALPQEAAERVFRMLADRLQDSSSATGRMFAALVIVHHTKTASSTHQADQEVNGRSRQALHAAVGAALGAVLAAVPATRTDKGQLLIYAELKNQYSQLHMAGVRLLKQCIAQKCDVSQILVGLTAEQYMGMLTAENMAQMAGLIQAGPNPPLQAAVSEFQGEVKSLVDAESQLHSRVKALCAACLIKEKQLPARLTLVIQPLMATLRNEGAVLIRSETADALAELLLICQARKPSPNEKIIANLAGLLTKQALSPLVPDSKAVKSKKSSGQTNSEFAALVSEEVQNEGPEFLGAQAAFRAIASKCGSVLLTALPSLEKLIVEGLAVRPEASSSQTGGSLTPSEQKSAQALMVLTAMAPSLASELDLTVPTWLPGIVQQLCSQSDLIRHCAAQCMAGLVERNIATFVPDALRQLSPLMSEEGSQEGQLGSLDVISQMTSSLDHRLAPYLYLLMVPVMRLMNRQDTDLRTAAAPVFAKLVTLLPLAQGHKMPERLSEGQQAEFEANANLLQQLLDSSQVPEFAPSFKIEGQLRQYQKAGISWMVFLDKCGLHGILADDMGLGKTLQSTLVLAESHATLQRGGARSRPSLVICPQILVGHWALEISKFVGKNVLTPLAYEGTPLQRQAHQKRFGSVDVVIMSYETLRSDSAAILKQTWNYCILDEGHVIRNSKSKVSQAVKQVKADHRLILSGTPIQNNVQELWALFDFLMPGFLGTEAAFNARYGKALLGGRTAKSGSADSQKALLAMDALHKQVAPFILRRTKDTVLKDLPPKIIQDIYCTLSPLQAAMYEEFTTSDSSRQVQASVDSLAANGAAQDSAPHIFQALQYLRKLCSHPLMAFDSTNNRHRQAALAHTESKTLPAAEKAMHSLEHAPKLVALLQLLQQCGIGGGPEDASEIRESDAPLHRVLVFAQYKSLLDIVESDVMQPHNIPFLRLDGSVEASKRFPIVQQFNEDSTIPVMLLTTSVGGLGLNLTSADTVIFLEHDWNPMKDLQAMDRAHRLGQKQTVNVYRLLMRDSLEERVLGLQRFKVDVANAVINEENATGSSLLSGAVLDLLGSSKEGEGKTQKESQQASGLKSALENLGDLWDEQQYQEEFNLNKFAAKLN